MLGDSDLDLFFADFGVDVTIRGVTTTKGAIPDLASRELLGETGTVLAPDPLALVKTATVPTDLAKGEALTVGGVSYKLRSPPAIWSGAPDGKFTVLLLATA